MSEPDDTPACPSLPPPVLLERIGRYQIERILGKGGFGVVYLAHDPQLDRCVAIKVPHPTLVPRPEDAELYIAEARVVAQLDHPHIVSVYDVGSSAEAPCFVVSKYIEGMSLNQATERRRPNYANSARLIAAIAEALHYAHLHGVVHRDVKPQNILIDRAGNPYLVDFGMALCQQEFGEGPQYVGTPSYMSPEQARGEGHRVDGRSDIFSLGVVFYILLTGCKPFHGDSVALIEQITIVDPRPPRQIDDGIPKELERICLKAMSKRVADRYTTAKDMVEDLRQFLGEQPAEANAMSSGAGVTLTPVSGLPKGSDTPPVREGTTPKADSVTRDFIASTLRIVPKGLRAFDERDSDFFLDLLPGTRDRDGLPDQVRFWKSRFEERNPDRTFAVGLIYGPSGCGKSSLMRAGLIPRLADHVITIFVEASTDDTEWRLLSGIRKQFPTLPHKLNLAESLAALRSGTVFPHQHKVLIILDQFEQWLHAKQEVAHAELVQALRHCDGRRVQSVVLVRDDFWLAATRFMGQLEIDLRQGENTALADLFDVRHARDVLAAFGRAFGALPADAQQMSKLQWQFLDQAIKGLAQDGRVICVRLALFAEMIKDKPWVPATLKQLGGIEGVGVRFLEETFSSPAANPQHRFHQRAARNVLKALLPEAGMNFKGSRRSYHELLLASGYDSHGHAFEDLIRILDNETRLITPMDADETVAGEGAPSVSQTGERYFQLSHDYLVRSLREWLTRKQKETRRGRAELCLADRASLWEVKPENRHLPSWWEWLAIQLLTSPKNWTAPQRLMMRSAAWVHGIRWAVALLILLSIAVAGQHFVAAQKKYLAAREENERERAKLLVDALLLAPAAAVPDAIQSLEGHQEHTLPLLKQHFAAPGTDREDRQRAAIALASFGQVQSEFLVDSIDQSPPGECGNIAAALSHTRKTSLQELHARAADAHRQEAWRQKARLAIVALNLEDASIASAMLRLQPDPQQRVTFISVLENWHGALDQMLHIKDADHDADLRSGLCLGIGQIKPSDISVSQLHTCTHTLLNWYQQYLDLGTHSAAAWALRQWNVPIPQTATHGFAEKRDWYQNPLGMTMVRLHAGSFVRRKSQGVGPKADEGIPQSQQLVTLSQPFWLSDREVSRGQFQQFMDDPADASAGKFKDWKEAATDRSPTLDHPVQEVRWVDAAMFCNWLSQQEKLSACYQVSGTNWDLVPGADGYRLPTEAEWEYACRAGTTTYFVSGNDDSLLGLFAVYQSHRMAVCGSKMPNGWGIFDCHGNAYEWCHDWFEDYGTQDRQTDPTGPGQGTERVIRGGASDYESRFASSSIRAKNRPTYRSFTLGFRVARSSR